MSESAEADFLAKAINEWKREFERIRWQQWESLSPREQRHAQDHTLGSYIVSDSKYPFTKRPPNCALSLYEIKLALWAAQGDFDEAAIRLRVTPDRLRQAIKGVSELEQYVPSKKQRKREAGEPLVDISLRNFGCHDASYRRNSSQELHHQWPCRRRQAGDRYRPDAHERTGRATKRDLSAGPREREGRREVSAADRTIECALSAVPDEAESIAGETASDIPFLFQECWRPRRIRGILQTTGTDVATAAKLTGHKTPNVTLQYYTHSLRGGREALNALDAIYFRGLRVPLGPSIK